MSKAKRITAEWQCGSRHFTLGPRTWVMAIVNLTPDSFYPASRYSDPGAVAGGIERAVAAGADAVDVGAESTRPGSTPVEPEEERSRLLPALAAIRRAYPNLVISVDTRRASTAAAALDAGADVINDVTGLGDPEMGGLVAKRKCGVILMHRRGDFKEMHKLPPLADPVRHVALGLAAIYAAAQAAGISPSQIVLDPGFGFGKNLGENFSLLAHLDQFTALGRPLLVGLSRKSFIGHLMGGVSKAPPEARLIGSLAAAVLAAAGGAHIVRTHDVAETLESLRIVDEVMTR